MEAASPNEPGSLAGISRDPLLSVEVSLALLVPRKRLPRVMANQVVADAQEGEALLDFIPPSIACLLSQARVNSIISRTSRRKIPRSDASSKPGFIASGPS